jgi:transposase-like protein
MRRATRAAEAAERCFRPVLHALPGRTPRVLTVDKHAAYSPAFEALQQEGILPAPCELRQCTYLHKVVEQDHRLVTRHVHPGLGCGAWGTA